MVAVVVVCERDTVDSQEYFVATDTAMDTAKALGQDGGGNYCGGCHKYAKNGIFAWSSKLRLFLCSTCADDVVVA